MKVQGSTWLHKFIVGQFVYFLSKKRNFRSFKITNRFPLVQYAAAKIFNVARRRIFDWMRQIPKLEELIAKGHMKKMTGMRHSWTQQCTTHIRYTVLNTVKHSFTSGTQYWTQLNTSSHPVHSTEHNTEHSWTQQCRSFTKYWTQLNTALHPVHSTEHSRTQLHILYIVLNTVEHSFTSCTQYWTQLNTASHPVHNSEHSLTQQNRIYTKLHTVKQSRTSCTVYTILNTVEYT